MVIFIALVVAGIGLWVFIDQKTKSAKIAEWGQFLKHTSDNYHQGFITVYDFGLGQSIPIVMLSDEYMVLPIHHCSLAEERSFKRKFYGASYRVFKGVYWHTGQSSSKPELTVIDDGDFILTNKRMVFLGKLRLKEVFFDEIVGIKAFKDALEVYRSKNQKAEVYYTYGAECIKIIFDLVMSFQWKYKEVNDPKRGLVRFLYK